MRSSAFTYSILSLLLIFILGCNANVNHNLAIIVLDSSGNHITNGSGSYEYDGILINTTLIETFTVQNTGSADLKLAGKPKVAITGTGASAKRNSLQFMKASIPAINIMVTALTRIS